MGTGGRAGLIGALVGALLIGSMTIVVGFPMMLVTAGGGAVAGFLLARALARAASSPTGRRKGGVRDVTPEEPPGDPLHPELPPELLRPPIRRDEPPTRHR